MVQFLRLFDLFFVAHFLYHNLGSDLFLSQNSLWSSLSSILWNLCFDFKWLIKFLVLETPPFV